MQVAAPPAWTTLELTIHADGLSEAALVGASPFPRHWIYDHAGALVAKSSVVEFDHWYRRTLASRSPWRGEETAVLVAGTESVVERMLGHDVMHGPTSPTIRSFAAGQALVEQGEQGRDVALLLDGMAEVIVDGRELGRVGPGAVFGERASLESQARTATLLALTHCTVAEVDVAHLDPAALRALRDRHRREHDRPKDDRRGVDQER